MTTYSFTTATSEQDYEYRAVFTSGLLSTNSQAARLTVVAPSAALNWSGQADVPSSGSFTSVSGSWTVPAVTCGSSETYSSAWIGIDGFLDGTVEQIGTEQDCSDASDYPICPTESVPTPCYFPWIEMFGDTIQDSNGNSYYDANYIAEPVAAGDSISASVSMLNDEWTLTLTDHTRHWTYTSPATAPFHFHAQQSSAEWIVERPCIPGYTCQNDQPSTFPPLADFSGVTFTSASTNLGAVSIDGDQVIDMDGDSSVISAASALDSSGTSFTVSWRGSS
jgi:hypothetical protein